MIDVGQTVGNYNVTAKLGQGGMGVVFLAEHPIIGSKVALKAISPQFAHNNEVISRFVNEAKSVNQIGHNHIVDITDFGSTPARDFYFIMEYLQGETLAALIRHEGALPVHRALNIAAQIADALQASHEHGVIHRDLKPDNIYLIARDGVDDFVKVLDFGIAKLITHAPRENNSTRAGSFIGTPFYMSPEQCEGKTDIDHRADIYALGVILFEMLTGMVPFTGDGYGEILVKHMMVQAPPARSIVPDLPAEIDAIVFRALSKNPGQRFQTMTEFRAALLDPARYASRRQRGGRRRPFRAIALGLIGVTALVAAVAIGAPLLKGPIAAHLAAKAARAPAAAPTNVNSDPAKAKVMRANDGVLGATSPPTQVPSSDTPSERVRRQDDQKTTMTTAATTAARPAATTARAARRAPRVHVDEPSLSARPPASPLTGDPYDPDDDGVLAPSIQ
ncbi:MAG TPA: serine/threonine-protein kinase [Polyangia bacterium]|jgi:hypothetical protein|nr:serine/threonine-protein kinase [Polyangia bacterium]